MKKTILLSACTAMASMAFAWSPATTRVKPGDSQGFAIDPSKAAVERNPLLDRPSSPATRLQPLAGNVLTPPLCETFDNFRPELPQEDFARYFKVIDVNNDKRKWGLYNVTENRPTGRCAYLLFPMEESGGKADDWLVTRGLELEAGKYYRISVDASLYRDDPDNDIKPQTFEVKCGMFNDADGLNMEVIPNTKVSSTEFTTVDGWLVPRLSGTYYIGVHGTSPYYASYYNYLFVDNINIDAARESSVPSKVTDIAMTNDPDGTTRIDFTFTAPSTDLAGNKLSGNVSVSVTRDGKAVKTLDNLTPGQRYSFSDAPAEGTHTYALRAANADGEGADAIVSRYAGIAAPVPPAITKIEETADHKLRYTWTAPATDINGSAINPDKVTYNIYDYTTGTVELVKGYIEGLTYTATIAGADERQLFATLLLSANFNDKESEMAVGDMKAIGVPYTIPHHNSFTLDDYDAYLMAVEINDHAVWRMLDDMSDPDAQDGDNGYISMICSVPDESCELTFGKIDLSGATHPALSFYTYIYEFDENEIGIKIIDPATGTKTTVETVHLDQLDGAGWTKVICPLDAYAGRTVQIVLDGVIRTHGYIPVDNLRVEQLAEVDYAVDDIAYPRGAEIGERFKVQARIANHGHAASAPYKVALKREGNVVDIVDGPSMAMLERSTVTLADALPIGAKPRSSYVVEVIAEGDEYTVDNTSAPFSIDMIVPTYPVATDLTLAGSGNNVTLSWTAPDLQSGGPEAVLEDFESYKSFDTELGGNWTMIDGDCGFVGGFNGVDMELAGTQQAWWVMADDSPFGFIRPHSGNKILTQMYSLSSDGREQVPSDDWVVSPELYGGCQTISFWASALTSDYGNETMEVYASKTGTEAVDFELVQPQIEVPADWVHYYFYLPAGTRHFAIRATTPTGYMLKVDDVTYVPAGTPVAVDLKGYNVYRNGVKLNDAPVGATTFATSQTGENDGYFVTAVYDRGESAASNLVGFGTSAIDLPTVDNSNAPVEYYNLQGIRVDSANLVPGIYIRRQGTATSKILVR